MNLPSIKKLKSNSKPQKKPQRKPRIQVRRGVETNLIPRIWALRMVEHYLNTTSVVASSAPQSENIGRRIRCTTPRSAIDWSEHMVSNVACILGLTVPNIGLGLAKTQRLFQAETLRQITVLEKKLKTPWFDLIDQNAACSLRAVVRLLALSDNETMVFAFLLYLSNESIGSAASLFGQQLSDLHAVQIVSKATALPLEDVQKAFASSASLMGSQLISWNHDLTILQAKFCWVSSSFTQQMMLPNFDPFSAMRDRICPALAPTLKWESFTHMGQLARLSLSYLRQALDMKKPGVNILLYGVPGSGKSEFSRALAHELKIESFEVTSQDEDGDPMDGPRRLQALRVLQRFSASRSCLLVFDEIEDVFPRAFPIFPKPSMRFKGWINRVLEKNANPCIWITNAIDALDPAIIRRFDITIEMKNPPSVVREVQLRQLPVALSTQAISTLASSDVLSPAVVNRAANVINAIKTEIAPDQTNQVMELIVNQTLLAQGHRPLKLTRVADAVYDPTYVNTDFDPIGLVEGIREAKSARLLFTGPPGTGKSAYARWLAEQLGKKIMIKRVSELLSRYVGEAEKNIAAAFSEATESGAVLVIDECDSFLQDRSKAQRSYEVTQVNEFLTCMEEFEGIFIASTNFIEALDLAALRRFDYKANFGFLKPSQAASLLAAHLKATRLSPALPEDLRQLQSLSNLTPGDFAAVARQHRFKPMQVAAGWVAALENECCSKPEARKKLIGFSTNLID
jgi:AAA+ superfamily predicted ATPase